MSHNETPHPDEIDHKIALALIETPKFTDQELAKRLNVSRRTISRRKNSATVKALVQQALAFPADEVRRLIKKSFDKIENHLDSTNPKISLAAAIHLTKLSEKILPSDVQEDVELKFIITEGNRRPSNTK